MNLEFLESFSGRVKKHKSTTKAAESMFCTQAAVSIASSDWKQPWAAACSNAAAACGADPREGEIFPA